MAKYINFVEQLVQSPIKVHKMSENYGNPLVI